MLEDKRPRSQKAAASVTVLRLTLTYKSKCMRMNGRHFGTKPPSIFTHIISAVRSSNYGSGRDAGTGLSTYTRRVTRVRCVRNVQRRLIVKLSSIVC